MNIKELLKSTTEPLPQGTLYEIIKAKRIDKEEIDSLDETIKNIEEEFGNLKNFFNNLNKSTK